MSPVGVMGGKWNLPLSFPLEVNGNSGDLIHTMAPLKIIPGSLHAHDDRVKLTGAGSFRKFVNDQASHLIIVLANTLRNNADDGPRYARFQRTLEQYEKPIVVFGLGMQAETSDLSKVNLPKEAKELMQFLSSRSELLGVRGEFTKMVLEQICGVENAYVTGCPSLYSSSEGLRNLYDQHLKLTPNLRDMRGRAAVSITQIKRESEKVLLANAIRSGSYLVEPVSRFGYEYHLALQNGEVGKVPYYLKSMLKDNSYGLTNGAVEEFYRNNYRYFRYPEPWLDFNSEYVSWSYGTRFHVNMATLLAGKPALWLTHDARTREMADFMHLPSADLEAVANMSPDEIFEFLNLDDFFTNLPGLYANFSNYLECNDLPGVECPI